MMSGPGEKAASASVGSLFLGVSLLVNLGLFGFLCAQTALVNRLSAQVEKLVAGEKSTFGAAKAAEVHLARFGAQIDSLSAQYRAFTKLFARFTARSAPYTPALEMLVNEQGAWFVQMTLERALKKMLNVYYAHAPHREAKHRVFRSVPSVGTPQSSELLESSEGSEGSDASEDDDSRTSASSGSGSNSDEPGDGSEPSSDDAPRPTANALLASDKKPNERPRFEAQKEANPTQNKHRQPRGRKKFERDPPDEKPPNNGTVPDSLAHYARSSREGELGGSESR